MAVTIWATNRRPTAVAVLLLDQGWRLMSVGVVVVLRVLMECPFGGRRRVRDSNGVRLRCYG